MLIKQLRRKHNGFNRHIYFSHSFYDWLLCWQTTRAKTNPKRKKQMKDNAWLEQRLYAIQSELRQEAHLMSDRSYKRLTNEYYQILQKLNHEGEQSNIYKI